MLRNSNSFHSGKKPKLLVLYKKKIIFYAKDPHEFILVIDLDPKKEYIV